MNGTQILGRAFRGLGPGPLVDARKLGLSDETPQLLADHLNDLLIECLTLIPRSYRSCAGVGFPRQCANHCSRVRVRPLVRQITKAIVKQSDPEAMKVAPQCC